MNKHRFLWLVIGLALFGCVPKSVSTPVTPQQTNALPTATTRSSAAPEASLTPTLPASAVPAALQMRIRIATNSDWTTLSFAGSVSPEHATEVSSSPEADLALYDNGVLRLAQPIGHAQSGDWVEMVADITFEGGSLSDEVEFVIDRGHLGATTLEIFRLGCGEPALIETFTWQDVQPSGANIQRYSLSIDRLLGSVPDEYTVIAQLNFWYYGPGEHGGFENRDGTRVTPLTPLLGEAYWASDPDVIYQQIEWASQYGVDAFSIEWTTPRGVGCCGSMEDTLDDVFLLSPNIHKVRWTIFYDFVLRLAQTPGLERHVGSFDFDEPDVYNTFVQDFIHFAAKYFGHPQYLAIDGRPVIYVWAAGAYRGDLAGAIREAREEVAQMGYDVFIVGDVIQANHFDPERASLFDANSTFTFLMGGLDFRSWEDLGDAIPEVDRTFAEWRADIQDLKVAGREDIVNFQPAWAPQYDDRFFEAGNDIYVPAMSMDQVTAMAEVARTHAQPVGSQGMRLIWLNTWNNWAETTTVEPTENLGPKYPAGNYQFDMLEVVRDVFGSETQSWCEP